MEGLAMITHFQYKSIYPNQQLPGWTFSFYYHRQKITGIYHPNGVIEWTIDLPSIISETLLKEQIHELMLFHVYEN
jgi:hypothetical protein